MNTKRVDYLNIGLILLSAILSFQYPLELFVVAFVILGPLHYFTEINWLDKKNYFIDAPKRLWLWIGVGSSVLVMIPKFYAFLSETKSGGVYEIMMAFNTWTNAFIFLSLIAALGFVMIKKKVYWLVLMLPAVLIAFLLNSNDLYENMVGLFLPTIIHVYLFTLIFMAYGAKKAKSAPGFFAVGLAIFIPVLIAGIDIPGDTFQFSDWMKETYVNANFHVTPVKTAEFFGWSDGTTFYFNEALEIKLMTFLSFIYLYHYLNWFSKTSLIKWHKSLTWKRSMIIAVTWALLLLLLYFNFQLGLLVAVLFSMIHVILEFPLNLVSIKGLFMK